MGQRFGNADVLLHAAMHVGEAATLVPHANVPLVGAAGQDAHTPGDTDDAPQTRVPAAQPWHLPAAQLAPAAHALPHAPQLAGSVWKFTQALPQRLGSAGMLHEATQVDEVVAVVPHAVVPLAGAAGQDAHALLQSSVPAGHVLQTPALHPAGQTFPHAPQFFGSLVVLTSQPVDAMPSQFAKPAAQTGFEQTEPAHVSVPPAVLHALAHAPQFLGSVDVLTSQPFAALWSQSAFGSVHIRTHALLTHVSVPPVAVHVAPHLLQLFMSLVVLTSQPLDARPSQSAKPAAHAVTVHVSAPATVVHASVAWLVLHAVLQSPQWLAVVIDVSQPFFGLSSQSARPGPQLKIEQLPPTHDSVAPLVLHGLAQPPQLFGSVLRLISQPFAALWSQSSKPVSHDVTEQANPVLVLLHASVAWVVLQTLPHAPQLLVVVVAVSQPFTALPSQSAKPGAHVILHVEATQVPVPPLWLHALPHAPQLLGSFVRLISQPLAGFASQSAKPALQAATAHFEAAHVSVASFVLHASPQPPQFFGSLVVLTSQPFAGLPSQSAVPAVLHADTAHT